MMKFSEFVKINPKIKMKIDKQYPLVDMKSIFPGERFVFSEERKKFKGGGSKFQNEDILFARITPCLENGKIAQYKSIDSEPSFGSTEFFIFRAKENIVNNSYLYYLCYSPIIRKTAEKSMVGASGRQRARLESIKDINIELPKLVIQNKIASILSAYDELIENNNRRIEILEEMAETIYKEWFVCFRFPGHEKVKMIDGIPEGWKKEKIFSIADINYGKNLPTKKFSEEGEYPVYGAAKIIGKFNKYTKERRTIITGCRGSVGQVTITRPKSYITNNSFTFEPKNTEIFYWLYFSLDLRGFSDVVSGTAQPQITLSSLSKIKLLFPNIKVIKEFDSKIESYFNLIFVLEEQNQKLAQARDLLLPRLMSGKIDVSDLDIKIEEKK
jgi:type I restriction enzyme, S subunit